MSGRAHLHIPRDLGERAAGVVARGLGSWRFVIGQSLILAVWVALNLAAWVRHWDPYPFILLNLALSTQAAFAAPVLQMAANRQDAVDRRRDDLEAAEVAELAAINREQLEILRLLREHTAAHESPREDA